MNLYKAEDIATLKARPSGSNIFLKWNWMNSTVPLFVQKTLVFFIQEGDSKVIILQHYDNSSRTEYTMTNVPQDINYNICIRAIMTAKWPGVRDPHICTNVTNSKWEMSAFVGSIAGALLALTLIILLVLMSKRVKKRQKASKANLNQNPQRQRYDSAFESQFDSVAFREDTSFYEDLVTSEVCYMDNSYRPSCDSSVNNNLPSVAVVADGSCVKTIKKRTSLIEEESTCSQSCDGWMYTITTKGSDDAYQKKTIDSEPNRQNSSPSHPVTENGVHILETCIDEVDTPKIIPNNVTVKAPSDQTLTDSRDKSPQKQLVVGISNLVTTDCLENL